MPLSAWMRIGAVASIAATVVGNSISMPTQKEFAKFRQVRTKLSPHNQKPYDIDSFSSVWGLALDCAPVT